MRPPSTLVSIITPSSHVARARLTVPLLLDAAPTGRAATRPALRPGPGIRRPCSAAVEIVGTRLANGGNLSVHGEQRQTWEQEAALKIAGVDTARKNSWRASNETLRLGGACIAAATSRAVAMLLRGFAASSRRLSHGPRRGDDLFHRGKKLVEPEGFVEHVSYAGLPGLDDGMAGIVAETGH